MGGAFALPNPPEPTCAVGWRPAARPPVGIPCPVAEAGLPGASRVRAAQEDSHWPVPPCQVCWWQTANVSHQSPVPNEAGEIEGTHQQARASESQRLASARPSSPLRLPRCERAQRPPAQSVGAKTVGRRRDGFGTTRSKAIDLRPTGRLKPDPLTKSCRLTSPSSCADTPSLVTGQEAGGMGMPGVAQRRCVCTLSTQLSSSGEAGAWPAITSL